MWHVSSRSGVATLRTAIHLLLTYLLHSQVCPHYGVHGFLETVITLFLRQPRPYLLTVVLVP